MGVSDPLQDFLGILYCNAILIDNAHHKKSWLLLVLPTLLGGNISESCYQGLSGIFCQNVCDFLDLGFWCLRGTWVAKAWRTKTGMPEGPPARGRGPDGIWTVYYCWYIWYLDFICWFQDLYNVIVIFCWPWLLRIQSYIPMHTEVAKCWDTQLRQFHCNIAKYSH